MKRLDHYWYTHNFLSFLLLPVSWLYCLLIWVRRGLYRSGILRVNKIAVPVVVVGNITAGGTGKTPLVIWLAEFLQARGWKPGIVSRGYGGKTRHYPQAVHPDSDPAQMGDEAVLLARRCGCPVVIAPHRADAARALLPACDIIIADDGLQHYALARDIEIAVIDGARRFGNGHCLPAGPLREPLTRLRTVNMKVCNGGVAGDGEFAMRLQPLAARNLADEARARGIESFSGETVHAVAAIGHPARFFNQLRALGLSVVEHAFPDHHHFTEQDFRFDQFDDGGRTVFMTEKDAVKCRPFAKLHYWYLPVAAELDPAFGAGLLELLEKMPHGPKTA
ncbi:MAG: tetraacyldisaccharide 4'-kinase [Gammaproteobacteria bacterium]|nr:tetraacyldisaccharide 4'-kinase [Gammaproteobacteria bacterium]